MITPAPTTATASGLRPSRMAGSTNSRSTAKLTTMRRERGQPAPSPEDDDRGGEQPGEPEQRAAALEVDDLVRRRIVRVAARPAEHDRVADGEARRARFERHELGERRPGARPVGHPDVELRAAALPVPGGAVGCLHGRDVAVHRLDGRGGGSRPAGRAEQHHRDQRSERARHQQHREQQPDATSGSGGRMSVPVADVEILATAVDPVLRLGVLRCGPGVGRAAAPRRPSGSPARCPTSRPPRCRLGWLLRCVLGGLLGRRRWRRRRRRGVGGDRGDPERVRGQLARVGTDPPAGGGSRTGTGRTAQGHRAILGQRVGRSAGTPVWEVPWARLPARALRRGPD